MNWRVGEGRVYSLKPASRQPVNSTKSGAFGLYIRFVTRKWNKSLSEYLMDPSIWHSVSLKIERILILDWTEKKIVVKRKIVLFWKMENPQLWNKQHFSSIKVAFPKIDTSCARVFNFTLFVCLSSPPFHSNSFSIKSSYPIIVTSRTRFATSPQSFLRPKDSQITAVTRSNFDPTTSPGIQTRPTCLRLLPGL